MGATAPRLTYCSNVHPAADLSQQLAALREHVRPIASAAAGAGRGFGLGGWWPARLVDTLYTDDGAREELAAALDRCAAPLWTLNVFPLGDFHQAVVKASVYAPDWGEEERLRYTIRCAAVGAALMKPGDVLPMSTLPLGYRGPADAPADRQLMASNLSRAAAALAEVEDRTGVRCVLALEPEPNCLLETAAEAGDFLEQRVLDAKTEAAVTHETLRRHLGVCVDLCHLAVVGEDPLDALAGLRRRGVAVPKIQVSSCLEVRDPAGLDELLTFEEPRYLHQTKAASGARALDLDEVRARQGEFRAGGRVRTHYHVPLDWDRAGAFGSTQAEVRRVLQALAAAPDEAPLLEVETYTWSVLGDAFGDAPLHERIQRELDWVAGFWKNGAPAPTVRIPGCND
ncbi:MAG: metabolite traffic protein EboE [Planctomycetota bacterium]|nr:metabolite traffic protein EboE [Planctomycetota bacterium]